MPVSASFTLIVPPPPTAPAVSEVPEPVPPAPAAPALRGILRPYRLGADGNPVTGSGADLRTSRVSQVLATTSRGPKTAGELRWNGAFGSQLERLRQSSFDETKAALAVIYTRDALARPLPNEVVEKAEVDVDDEDVAVTVFTREKAVLRSQATAVTTTVNVRR